jgi:outer membrane protein assembly factor BamB
MPSPFAALALAAALAPLAPVPKSSTADQWPQWRGPNNDGHSPATGLPDKWSENENVLWKCKLPGPGAGTPCIWGDHIFLTAVGDKALLLVCIGTDGKVKWEKPIGAGNKAARGDEGNSASASCSTDGELVYAFVGDGSLVAYDFAGNEKWKVDTVAKYGKFEIQFGAHWSPVLHQGKLYVCLMHRKLQQIICFDAKTGKEEWKADRTSDGKGESPDVYSSPFVWEKGNKAALIVHGNDYCTAHDLKDGKELWRVTELNPKAKYNMAWRAVSSPLVTPDLIIVPSCKNGVTVAVDPNTAKGEIAPDAKTAGELWRIPKDTPDVPCPILVNGTLFVWKENSNLLAYDAKTGKKTGELKLTNERHRASPVFADGKLILVGREGNMATVKAKPEPETIEKMKLPDTFTASPAVSGGRIYLRGWNHLWAIGTK